MSKDVEALEAIKSTLC